MSPKKPTKTRCAALFAFLTVTGMALFFNLYEPWIPIGSSRISDGSFETPECTKEWTGWNRLSRWEPTAGYKNSAGLVLETDSSHHSTLRKVISETDNIPAFKVSVRAKAENVQGGEQRYHLPRVVFFYRNSSGKAMYHHSHTVFSLKKDADWRQYSAIFPQPEDVLDGRLYLQNLGSEGTLHLDDLYVFPVTHRPSAPFFQVLFILLWIAAFSICLIAFEPWKSLPGTGSLLCALAIIVGVLLPGKLLDDTIIRSVCILKQTVQRTRLPAPQAPTVIKTEKTPTQPSVKPAKKMPTPKKPTPKTESPTDIIVRNTHAYGHFSLFLMLAMLSILTWAPSTKPIRLMGPVLAGLALFAASTEVLQFITPDRKAGLSDLITDCYGILLAIVLMILVRLLRGKLRPRSQAA